MEKFHSRLGVKTWGCLVAAALLAGTVCLGLPSSIPDARAQGRSPPAPRAFLSGGERSEIILREIAETLRRIDARLERLEKAVFEGEPASAPASDAAGGSAPAAPNTSDTQQP